MINNYWVKDATRTEIITKTQIPNKNNFKLFACYFNLMDKKALAFQVSKNTKIEKEPIFTKNGSTYFIVENDEMKELTILPHQDLIEYVNRIISKIDNCTTENDVLNLIIEEM